MHIGLNLIYLVPGETGGTEVVARELLPALVAARPQVRFTLFVNREAAESGDGFFERLAPCVTVPVRARRRVEWVRGEQQLLPRLARARRRRRSFTASPTPAQHGAASGAW